MIETKGLSFRYPEGTNWILRELDIQFHDGEVVLLAGPNGGGKSTLLKALMGVVPYISDGTRTGQILLDGQDVSHLQTMRLAGKMGIVLQDPSSQISHLTVEDEIQFGPANLCLPKEVILEQTATALQALGISHLRRNLVLSLSGGQLQRLSLASLLAMKPEVLILDEPVTNLDPLGVYSVVEAIRMLSARVKVIIISSHWLDPFLEFVTRVVIMDEGKVVIDDRPQNLSRRIPELKKWGVQIPHQWLLPKLPTNSKVIPYLRQIWSSAHRRVQLELSKVGYRYDQDNMPLRDIDLQVVNGERLALVGHNGEGKTTLAKIMVGLLKPTMGKIRREQGPIGMMLQKPSLGFVCNTVKDEISFGAPEAARRASALLEEFDLAKYADQSPFLLSGGEQRRLSLAIALSQNPQLMILDESTAGLDADQVDFLLTRLAAYEGVIVHVTHDTRIVGKAVDRLAVVGSGTILFHGPPDYLDHSMLQYLGYDRINPTVALAMKHLGHSLPMLPEQVEVAYGL